MIGAPIERRKIFALLGGLAAALPLRVRAQTKSIPVIGFLNIQSPAGWEHFVDAFRLGLKESGFVADDNVTIEYRWADAQVGRLPDLAAELVARKVSVLVATGGIDPVKAAKAATSIVPIVFTMGPDPVRLGVVESLARPGGNLTGFTLFAGVLAPKRLELLRELVPGGSPVAVLVNPEQSGTAGQLGDLQAAAATLSTQLKIAEARSLRDIEAAFDSIAASGIRALLVASDAFYYAHRAHIAALAADRKIPAIYESRDFVSVGGLASYGVNFADIYRRAGVYAARILKGEKPADLPVEQPTKFELVVNLTAAKALNLTLPPSILVRADEVIE